MHKLIVCGC